MTLGIALFAFLLAYANGANDNFKGVATLFGSRSAGYRLALGWATATTLAGSAVSFLLAEELVRSFTGAGLVPPGVAASETFLASVAAGAGATVLVATRLGLPVSTTHALLGALVGVGALGGRVDLSRLGSSFLLPLLVSPILALLLALGIYPILRRTRLTLGVARESCVCVGSEFVPVSALAGAGGSAAAIEAMAIPTIRASTTGCVDRYRGEVAGISAQTVLDGLHFLSAGAVSFARGLNDTPKIAALLLGAGLLGGTHSVLIVGIAMALGGVLAARRVAETMSNDITPMNAGQGFTANAVSAFLIVLASRWGLPVSTTHVTCGALFGIGAATGEGRRDTIARILAAWVTTLPLGAALGAATHILIA